MHAPSMDRMQNARAACGNAVVVSEKSRSQRTQCDLNSGGDSQRCRVGKLAKRETALVERLLGPSGTEREWILSTTLSTDGVVARSVDVGEGVACGVHATGSRLSLLLDVGHCRDKR